MMLCFDKMHHQSNSLAPGILVQTMNGLVLSGNITRAKVDLDPYRKYKDLHLWKMLVQEYLKK